MCKKKDTNFTITRTIVIYPVGTGELDKKRAEIGEDRKNTRKRLISVLVKVVRTIIMLASICDLIDRTFS
jgi:hypothetical protein